MNKEIYNSAKTLNEWLLSQEVIIEYRKLEAYLSAHPDVLKKEEELKELQKQIVNKKHTEESCVELIEQYEVKKKSFEEHPILHNYLTLKQEVNELLQEVQNDIQEQLLKKVD